jgi:hypothetical protein
LLAVYALRIGWPRKPISDDMLMIDPPPRALIRGTACLMHSSVPRTLIAIVSSTRAMSMSTARVTGTRHAGVVDENVGPPARHRWRRRARHRRFVVTSATIACAPVSARLVERRTLAAGNDHARSGSGERASDGAPMPVPPPVISAILSCRFVDADACRQPC